MKKKKRTKQAEIKALLEEAIEIKPEIEAAKMLYRRMDEIVMKLIDLEFDEARVNGCLVSMLDNFSEKNTAFRIARVNRFELHIDERASLPLKKLKNQKRKWDFPTKKHA